MEHKSGLTFGAIVVILIILFTTWNMPTNRNGEEIILIEKKYGAEEAEIIMNSLGKTYDPKRVYFTERFVVINKSRTIIPFMMNTDTLRVASEVDLKSRDGLQQY